ncbi:SGNH/GDSL hydrolase family protein [Dolichospermum circinale]|uniref:SGNH/GDSL hydrolase family protein n=1 Tax=Dolichospermum circinale TaxID=109265 RepID=UPI00232CAAD7|nr:SGNH/GDSL hydrolase family protein [Dolichospermum circinale]MDB9450157.1 SGNH/GDSL hydrolase family protein [Dolichospermum circinale CS-547]
MNKLKGWAKVSLIGILILCGLVFGLVIGEIGLRIAGIEYKVFNTIDEHRGWTDRPGDSGWYRLEGESYIQINSEGFRDREHTKAKPENTLRIALLGDSFVAAYEVPLEEGFAAVIERELSGCKSLSGQKVEVIKFGTRAYGTDQELITLREKVWAYSPDIVILAFYTGNDVVNNSQALYNKALSYNLYKNIVSQKPYFIFKDGHLVLDTSFLNTDAYRSRQSWWGKVYESLLQNSRLLQVFRHAKYALAELLIQPPTMQETTTTKVGATGFMLENEIYKQPTDSTWLEAWQVTEELIKSMHNDVIAKEADFMVVTLSNDIQVHPDRSLRQKFMENLRITDFFYPDLRIKLLGDQSGFAVLNLAQTFQDYAQKNQVPLHGFNNDLPWGGHWNAQGHQLAGKMIAQKLCQQQEL